MSLSLASIQFKAALQATVKNQVDNTNISSIDLGIAQGPPTSLQTGTGANQANRFWQSTARILTAGTHEDINLYSFAGIDIGAGAGNGPLGGAMALIEIVGILVVNETVAQGSIGTLTIGGVGAASGWTSVFGTNTDTIKGFSPGSCWEIFNPVQPAWVVGSANNNLLRIAAVTSNVLYDIYVLGRQ